MWVLNPPFSITVHTESQETINRRPCNTSGAHNDFIRFVLWHARERLSLHNGFANITDPYTSQPSEIYHAHSPWSF